MYMSTFNQLITLCWIIFVGYWLISSLGIKKNLNGRSFWQGARFRIGVIIVIFLLIQIPTVRNYFHAIANSKSASSNLILDSIGVALAVIGVALAIWARVHLGRNWGMPMSIKEKPDLVTSGPYAYIRHPIYTGILMAFIGSAFVNGVFWFIPFVIFTVYFIYAAKSEEILMQKEFPNQYPAYMKKTKMLIPFIY